MELPERDGDGYLVDMSDWTPEIGRAMAEADGYSLDDMKWSQILKAREYYEDMASVPPIRKFAKYLGQDQKELFELAFHYLLGKYIRLLNILEKIGD